MNLRHFSIMPLLFALSACGGGSDKLFFGSVLADPDQTGAFPGVAPSDIVIIENLALEPAVGFAYARVDAATYNSNQAVPGDPAQFAIAGVLPDVSFGPINTSGSESYSGQYGLVSVSGAELSPSPDDWIVENDAGAITIEVNFGTGEISGQSADGLLRVETPSANGPLSDAAFGAVSYKGVSGRFRGVAGANGVALAFEGDGSEMFYAGGLVVE